MAPACCIISVKSEPKPSPSLSNCETTLTKGPETIRSYSEVIVRFSHTTYTCLYHKFIWENNSEDIRCSISLDRLFLSINFDVTWTVEKNEFTFDNQQDAESWKKLVPFCEASGSPERLKAFDEIKPEKFKELLNISEEDWDNAWNSSSHTKLSKLSASDSMEAVLKAIEKERKAAEKKAINEEKERKKVETKERKEREKIEKKKRKEKEKIEKRERKEKEKEEKRKK